MLRLAVSAAGMLLLLFCFGQLAKQYLANIGTVPAGLVAFLAVHEIVALPFMLLHLPFTWYWPIFLVINGAIVVWALVKHPVSLRLKAISSMSITLVLMIVTVGLITQLYARYSADDSLYVSLMQQNISSSHLYVTDPATGNPDMPVPVIYRLGGWELMLSGLSLIFRLPVVVLAHSMIPLVIVSVFFLAHKAIFQRIVNKYTATLALALLGVLIFFSGYSRTSVGTLLLFNAWQGKVILSFVLVPIVIGLLLSQISRKRLLAGLVAVNIAGIALSSTAIYILLAVEAVFGLMWLWKSDQRQRVWQLAISALPLLAAAVYYFASRTKGLSSSPESISYVGHIDRTIGSSWHYYLLPISLVLLWRWGSKLKPIAQFSLLYLVAFANPVTLNLLIPFLGNASGRLLRSIPLTLVIPLSGALVIYQARHLFKTKTHQTIARLGAAVLVIALIAYGGTSVRQIRERVFAQDASAEKVPPGIAPAGKALAELPPGIVLASTVPAEYLRNFSSNHELLVSRMLYLNIAYPQQSQEYKERLVLHKFVNGDPGKISFEHFSQLLDKYRVDYAFFPAVNQAAKSYFDRAGWEVVHQSKLYNGYRNVNEQL